MAQRKTTEAKTEPKPPASRKPPESKPASLWDGLSADTVRELRHRGYQCRDDLLLFLERPRFVNKSERGQRTVYDPLHLSRPWLNEGVPMRMPLDLFNQVRAWLGGDWVAPGGAK